MQWTVRFLVNLYITSQKSLWRNNKEISNGFSPVLISYLCVISCFFPLGKKFYTNNVKAKINFGKKPNLSWTWECERQNQLLYVVSRWHHFELYPTDTFGIIASNVHNLKKTFKKCIPHLSRRKRDSPSYYYYSVHRDLTLISLLNYKLKEDKRLL